MDRMRFRDFLQDNMSISSELLADRLFKYFNKVSNYGEEVDNEYLQVTKHDDIDIEEWVLGLSVMLKGSRSYNKT